MIPLRETGQSLSLAASFNKEGIDSLRDRVSVEFFV